MKKIIFILLVVFVLSLFNVMAIECDTNNWQYLFPTISPNKLAGANVTLRNDVTEISGFNVSQVNASYPIGTYIDTADYTSQGITSVTHVSYISLKSGTNHYTMAVSYVNETNSTKFIERCYLRKVIAPSSFATTIFRLILTTLSYLAGLGIFFTFSMLTLKDVQDSGFKISHILVMLFAIVMTYLFVKIAIEFTNMLFI